MFKKSLLSFALAIAFGAMPSQPTPQTNIINAKRFEFSPSEITVHKGVPSTIVLNSIDVSHGLVIKELKIFADVKKGASTKITFVPTETGDFVGNCAHFCGAGHGKMHLTVHVR